MKIYICLDQLWDLYLKHQAKQSCILTNQVTFAINHTLIPNLFIKHFIAKKKTTNLLYHNPKKVLFDKHLIYLTKKYNAIPLKKLIEAINNKKDLDKETEKELENEVAPSGLEEVEIS